MNNKEQSSVDWLIGQLKISTYWNNLISELEIMDGEIDIIKQAKEMNKQELIDFADDYVDNCVIPNENMAIPTYMDVPEFYKTKFEK